MATNHLETTQRLPCEEPPPPHETLSALPPKKSQLGGVLIDITTHLQLQHGLLYFRALEEFGRCRILSPLATIHLVSRLFHGGLVLVSMIVVMTVIWWR